MTTLRVHDFLKDKILISRESARELENMLAHSIGSPSPTKHEAEASLLTVDFQGVQGVAPSFLDELLLIFSAHVASKSDGRNRSLVVANPPTRLSRKFEAVARGHGMVIHALDNGSWLLTRSTQGVGQSPTHSGGSENNDISSQIE